MSTAENGTNGEGTGTDTGADGVGNTPVAGGNGHADETTVPATLATAEEPDEDLDDVEEEDDDRGGNGEHTNRAVRVGSPRRRKRSRGPKWLSRAIKLPGVVVNVVDLSNAQGMTGPQMLAREERYDGYVLIRDPEVFKKPKALAEFGKKSNRISSYPLVVYGYGTDSDTHGTIRLMDELVPRDMVFQKYTYWFDLVTGNEDHEADGFREQLLLLEPGWEFLPEILVTGEDHAEAYARSYLEHRTSIWVHRSYPYGRETIQGLVAPDHNTIVGAKPPVVDLSFYHRQDGEATVEATGQRRIVWP